MCATWVRLQVVCHCQLLP
uniref:Uncharacterized protein n=1 Tax=Arundo donax TaxID=35708 RepID=A0A0A9BCE8_ARUDO